MGFAMLSIMLFHQQWLSIFPFSFFHQCGHFFVDIFFFLSGFGSVYSLRKDNSILGFYKRRLYRLAPLCILCGLLKYFLAKGGFVDVIVNRNTIFGFDLWFLAVLWFYYLFTPLFLYLADKFKVLLVISLSLLSFIVISSLHSCDYVTSGFARLPSFILGILVASGHLKLGARYLKWGGSFVVLTFLYRTYIRPVDPTLFKELYAYLILSMGLCSLCYWVLKLLGVLCEFNVVDKILIYIGMHSLELYLWHEYIYRAVKIQNPIMAFVLAIVLSFTAVKISDKILNNIKLLVRIYETRNSNQA